MTELIPAILTNDVSDFRKKYAEIFALNQYFTKLHVDFADGEFVKNKTIMPKDLEFIKSSPMILVAHFMTMDPLKYFEDAKNAGFKQVLFHYEAYEDENKIDEMIVSAKNLDLKTGLVLNPDTPLHIAAKFLQKVDLVQLMGIHPGFQGREFIPATIDRIKELRSLSKNVIIAVDGGIRVDVARQCAQAGADILVAGSAILKAEDEAAAIEALKQDIETK